MPTYNYTTGKWEDEEGNVLEGYSQFTVNPDAVSAEEYEILTGTAYPETTTQPDPATLDPTTPPLTEPSTGPTTTEVPQETDEFGAATEPYQDPTYVPPPTEPYLPPPPEGDPSTAPVDETAPEYEESGMDPLTETTAGLGGQYDPAKEADSLFGVFRGMGYEGDNFDLLGMTDDEVYARLAAGGYGGLGDWSDLPGYYGQFGPSGTLDILSQGYAPTQYRDAEGNIVYGDPRTGNNPPDDFRQFDETAALNDNGSLLGAYQAVMTGSPIMQPVSEPLPGQVDQLNQMLGQEVDWGQIVEQANQLYNPEVWQDVQGQTPQEIFQTTGGQFGLEGDHIWGLSPEEFEGAGGQVRALTPEEIEQGFTYDPNTGQYLDPSGSPVGATTGTGFTGDLSGENVPPYTNPNYTPSDWPDLMDPGMADPSGDTTYTPPPTPTYGPPGSDFPFPDQPGAPPEPPGTESPGVDLPDRTPIDFPEVTPVGGGPEGQDVDQWNDFLQTMAQQWMESPSRYDADLVQEGQQVIENAINEARNRGTSGLEQYSASRGLTGSSLEFERMQDFERQMQELNDARQFELGREQALTYGQDRGAAFGAGLSVGGQLQGTEDMRSAYGIQEQQLALQRAGLMSDDSYRNRVIELQEQGMSLDDAFRRAQLEQQESQFSRGLDLDRDRFGFERDFSYDQLNEQTRQFDTDQQRIRDFYAGDDDYRRDVLREDIASGNWNVIISLLNAGLDIDTVLSYVNGETDSLPNIPGAGYDGEVPRAGDNAAIKDAFLSGWRPQDWPDTGAGDGLPTVWNWSDMTEQEKRSLMNRWGIPANEQEKVITKEFQRD